MERVEKIIREYLPEVIHLSLATCVDNKPWVCEVHYAYDDDLNLYFISRPSRRHSLEAKQNPLVAGNIVKQYGAGESVRGVYFEGQIEQLAGVTGDHAAFQSYQDRFGLGVEKLAEQQEEDGHRWYKISVEKFYLFDELELKGKHELVWS